ncbi:hypothetical protein FHG87_004265 [Trinorchestia longiramus]|nr:hypothetical protein FHG87_004265 [Trinorchestia longiramus]
MRRTTHQTAVEVIGGSDEYIAVCRECCHKNAFVKSSLSSLKDWNERLVRQASVGGNRLEFHSTSSQNEKENEISVAESALTQRIRKNVAVTAEGLDDLHRVTG